MSTVLRGQLGASTGHLRAVVLRSCFWWPLVSSALGTTHLLGEGQPAGHMFSSCRVKGHAVLHTAQARGSSSLSVICRGGHRHLASVSFPWF